jgi:hypothetical protein
MKNSLPNTTKQTRKAVYAKTLYCDTGEHDAVYNIQLVEYSAAKERFRIEYQYGKSSGKLTAKNDLPTTFLQAREKFQQKVADKMKKGRDREYVENPVVSLPDDIVLMSPEEVKALEKGRPAPGSVPIFADIDDPEIQTAIHDEMYVAINSGNTARSLMKEGQVTKLRWYDQGRTQEKVLDPTHPYAVDAAKIGGEFNMAGYIGEDSVFYAFDLTEASYHNWLFAERIQEMARILEEAQLQHIAPATYFVGTEAKQTLAEEVAQDPANKRMLFMRLDQDMRKAQVRYFPSYQKASTN